MDGHTLGAACLICICFCILPRLSSLVSFIVNHILVVSNPIHSVDGKNALPTRPWQFPGGQSHFINVNSVQTSKIMQTKYGHVYRIWAWRYGEVVITRPEDVRIVFADSDQHIKAHQNNSGWLFGQLLGSCLGEVNGVQRKQLLVYLGPAFAPKQSKAYIDILGSHIRTTLDKLAENADTTVLTLTNRSLRQAALAAFAEILFGPLTPQQTFVLFGLVPTREKLLMKAFTNPTSRFSWSRHIPNRTNRELAWFRREFETLVNTLTTGDSKSLTPAGVMMAAVYEGKLDKIAALQTLDEILFANLDVTAGAMAWAIVLIAEDRVTQTEIRDEILRIRREKRSWKDFIFDNKSILAAAVQESGRLRPLASFSVPQAPQTDRIVGGYRIPKGNNFIVDSYALNVMHSVWGDDAEIYRPGRWLERWEEGQDHDLRYQLWRFGFGPRQCLGKHVADLLLRLVLFELLEIYELQLEPDCTDASAKDDSTWITTPAALVNCIPHQNR